MGSRWAATALGIIAVILTCAAQDAPTFRAGVNVVRVAVAATDHDGKPVRDLRMEDFILLDNGKPRAIETMWREDNTPLTIGLVEDISGSQRTFIVQHRDALVQFIGQVLRPQDQTFLVGVAPDVTLFTDFTNSIATLRAGITSLTGPRRTGARLGPSCAEEGKRCGGSALWNGVYYSARLKMKGIGGREAMIFLTDGLDSGSSHHLVDAIEAAQSADTLVYTIRYSRVPPRGRSLIPAPGGKAQRNLERLAKETGGRAFESSKATPAEIFAEIEDELRNLYVLGFTLPGSAQDGKFHNLGVKCIRPGVVVRARKGYTAGESR